MYNNQIKDAIEAANADYQKLMNMATNTSTTKHPEEEAIKDKWLMAEGFAPIITPEKEIKFVPKPKHATELIQNYQKGQNSMSNETLTKAYPFLQYAIDNYIPVLDGDIQSLQNGDLSQQYLNENIMRLMKEGIKEAIEATGGYSKQGKMMVAKAANVAQAANILSNSTEASKQLGGE
ncbi:hypothetical protein QUQ16_000187 [Escherichia coli]|nr:hypothetical protein [Escherichia coli]